MKVLLTGAAGQLGKALIASCPEGVELISSNRNGGPGLEALDLADASACGQAVETYRPDWVLNAGAYTAVDKAESEPELALAVNALAPAAFAQALHDQCGMPGSRVLFHEQFGTAVVTVQPGVSACADAPGPVTMKPLSSRAGAAVPRRP